MSGGVLLARGHRLEVGEVPLLMGVVNATPDSFSDAGDEDPVERARELLAAEPAASLTMDRLRELLSDHETKPQSLCKHPEFGTPTSKTVFWCVADVTDGRIRFGRGNPCDSVAQEYLFESYAGREAAA